MTEFIAQLNRGISKIIWGPLMIAFLLFTGAYLTVKTGFFQLRFKKIFKATIGEAADKSKQNKAGISPFASMSAALGGTLGTGNIVGVATALIAGGPGAIFWMWVSAFFGMITKYAEVLLACVFRVKDPSGNYFGGPMYYMKNGLNSKFLAAVFSVVCIIASLGMGNMAQSNAVSTSLSDAFKIPVAVSGAATAVVTAVIISGGMKRITGFTEKLVPIMGIAYTVGAAVIIAVNFKKLPFVAADIIKSAFKVSSVAGGCSGYIMSNAVRYGVSRGVFSNEAGVGSAPMAHAAANFTSPVKQAMWGIFEVFFDTVIMCTLTALAILCSGVFGSGSDGAALTNEAFASVFGGKAKYILSVFIAFFAVSSIICWAYYGETSLKYLFHKSKKLTAAYRALFVIFTFIGSAVPVSLVFEISDTLNGLMALPNIIAVLLLSPVVIKYTKSYLKSQKQQRRGS